MSDDDDVIVNPVVTAVTVAPAITAVTVAGTETALTVTPDVTTVIVQPVATYITVAPIGLQGPPGPPGSGGGGGGTLTVTSGMALSGHRVVRPQSDGTVVYADNTVLADATRPLWLTLGATGASGQPVDVQAFGQVIEPTWSWVDGPIFLGANGVLTQTPPTHGGGAAFLLQVAAPDGPTALFYDVRTPIAL